MGAVQHRGKGMPETLRQAGISRRDAPQMLGDIY
jgi:hypothetical protein